MSGGNEAYDAEVIAVALGISHFDRRAEEGKSYTLFTYSQAAMRRIADDAP